MEIIYSKDIKLSDEAQKELNEIHKKVEEDLKPLYEQLGVNMETEELHWTSGEVFVINKKTRERREIGQDQNQLNDEMMHFAIVNATKHKKEIKECKGNDILRE